MLYAHDRRDSPVKSEHGFQQKLSDDMIEALAKRLADLPAQKSAIDNERVQMAFRKVESGEIRWCWGVLVERVPIAVGVADKGLMLLGDAEDEATWIGSGRLVRFDRSEQMARRGRDSRPRSGQV